MVKIYCDTCSKEINVKPSKLKKYRNHFCSNKCFRKWLTENTPHGENSPRWKEKITVHCASCNKELKRNQSRIKKTKIHFCSKSCHFEWKKENTPKGEDSPLWDSILVSCDFCDKKIYLPQNRMRNKHHFCSIICYFDWLKENGRPSGRENLQWNRIITNCEICNKELEIKPSHYNKTKHHFCSDGCQNKWQETNRGESNKNWNRVETSCAFCGNKIYKIPHRLQKYRLQFCNMNCMAKWKKLNLFGDKNPHWNGGGFYCYGDNWLAQKRKILKRANHVSELSGNNGGKMGVHHIIPVKNFIRKFIDLGLRDIPSVEISSFKVLPYDLIPSLIFMEANAEENLMYLTQSEHMTFEGMPPTFFEEIKRLNVGDVE